MLTPFGESINEMVIAPGITLVGTATHTMYRVSGDKRLQMPACLRDIVPTVTIPTPWSAWYEGIDKNIVILAFPEYFSEKDCYKARRAIFHAPWPLGDYFQTRSGQIGAEMAARYITQNAHKWVQDCLVANDSGVQVKAHHMTTGQHMTVVFPGSAKWKELPDEFTLEEAEKLGGEVVK